MYSTDKFVENTERIGEIFPSCITESKNANGETVKSIDFDLLRQELSNEIVVDGKFTFSTILSNCLLIDKSSKDTFSKRLDIVILSITVC